MADGPCAGEHVVEDVASARRKRKDLDLEEMSLCERDEAAHECATKAVSECCEGESARRVYVGDASKEAATFLPCEDDCRKKRCVDRYDSSESSDSGVAVLSCTDCSGSSTTSDITDPGSPYSTASNHSLEDAQTKMPPSAQPWPWTVAEELKGALQQSDNAALKRRKSDDVADVKRPPSLTKTNVRGVAGEISKGKKEKRVEGAKQGKITEYFKSQVKLHLMKKAPSKPPLTPAKPTAFVDQQTQFNGVRAATRTASTKKARKLSHHVTVPRKILPAPSKLPDKAALPQVNFAPTMTLTAVGLPPNLAYLHTKAPKLPDGIFVPQFATITNNNTIPILNRPCLNVLQPVPKLLNNFNCVKLNATVVPIVKLNTLPLSVETAQPTVIAAKPKTEIAGPRLDDINAANCRLPSLEEMRSRRLEDKSPSPSSSSDSGVSLKDSGLAVTVEGEGTPPPQKSPILSQPKTIRFPPAKPRDGKEDTKQEQESGRCRWAECNAQFDTSGALLEHLQIKHVISQTTEAEQYVCLWLGCKVHGRTSCSRSWLERHVLAHAGTKPFRCIVDGCGHRFNSQLTLERHVNGHFNGDSNQNGSAKKKEESSVKLFKRNGKKIRFRRQPWSARMFDFMDGGIMEGLQHKLLTMTQDRTMGEIPDAGNAVNVLSQVVARRVEPDGNVKFLVKWNPAGILPDEWMTEKEYVPVRSVHIPSLQVAAKEAVGLRLFPPRRRRPRKSAPDRQT